MPIALLLLVIAIVIYIAVALHPRRFGTSSDLTAIGLALIALTMLVLSGAF